MELTNWELDHVFLATQDFASMEQSLTAFGVVFTEHRVHVGQGTANACAFFENAFLEILRPHDAQELGSDAIRPLGLRERIYWRETGACPLGICIRPKRDAKAQDDLPRSTWDYQPPYAIQGAKMPVLTPLGNHQEPLVFAMFRACPEGLDSPFSEKSTPHAGSRRRLTSITITSPDPKASASQSIDWLLTNQLLSLVHGVSFGIEVQWDYGQAGECHSFPTDVPITLRW